MSMSDTTISWNIDLLQVGDLEVKVKVKDKGQGQTLKILILINFLNIFQVL